VRDLSINTWRYTAESGVDHVGPMAEDFHDAFGLGPDDEHITTVDADGVLFAAVQALAERCDEAKRELDEKDDRIDDLEERVEHRDDRITALGAENDALRDRLAAIDDRVASLESGHAHPATGDD
jgi:uncharacterized coiled-coil protein SlyX